MEASNLKDFTYYSRIVMFILCSIQFILAIVFIAVIYDVKDTINENATLTSIVCKSEFLSYKEREQLCKDFKSILEEQGQGIATTFSFFLIAYVIFFIECILHFCCENKKYDNEIFNNIFSKWNHFIILSAFIICQFMYLVSCLIIPIYLDRVRTIRDLYKDVEKDLDEVLNSCVNRYAALLVVAFTFLFIFIFLYFIIMNLYKDICCDMTAICTQTELCLKNFFRCYYLQIRYIFTCSRDDGLDVELNKAKEKVDNLTVEVKSLMAENLKLRFDKINYL